MKNLKIIYFGTPDFSATVLEGLINQKLNITTVVTKKDSPVSKVAQKNNIIILTPDKLNQEFIKENSNQLDSDLFIVFAYGKIIPKILLEAPKLGAFNLHPSILPKYRGASPIQQAILEGDSQTGVTVMLMDEQMDHGPILAVKEFEISSDETFLSLSKKMSQQSTDLLIKTIKNYLEKKIQPAVQDDAIATYCPILTRDSGYIDITNPPDPQTLAKMIRAYHPWPGVWTRWNGKIVKLLSSSVIPAKVHNLEQSRKVGIHTNILIQMESKKAVDLKSFLNGYPNFPLKSIG